MNPGWESGLVLLCDAQGSILQVLCNDLAMTEAVPGRLFFRLVDSASRAKALDFLSEIKVRGAVIDWELNVKLNEGVASLHFSGGQTGEAQILIVGATSSKFTSRLYEELLRINNEQTNLLRTTIKDQSTHSQDSQQEGLIFDDISRLNNELVGIQRELAKKNAELERLNELKNQFLGMAAHDLRNPLYAIQSYSELLLDEGAASDGTGTRDILREIHHLSQYMSNLVNNLLSVSVIEAGQLRLELQVVDLKALLQKIAAHSRLLAARKHIEIDLEMAPVPNALVDSSKIEQVLDNLISNAVKFSPPGGRVIVHLKSVEAGILLAVEDQGPGIPDDGLEKLFQPYGRTRAKTTGGEPSTGLGLTISKRIVEGHGGRIWVESQAGRGSVFYVSIPVSVGVGVGTAQQDQR